jgi:hypothetical protein
MTKKLDLSARRQEVEESLMGSSHDELLELAHTVNLQDPCSDFEDLVEQLTPIVAFSEFLQELKEALEDGDYLLAIREGEDAPDEIFGWYVDLDETSHILYLSSLDETDLSSIPILLSEDTLVRVCQSPREEAEETLSRPDLGWLGDGDSDLSQEVSDLSVELKAAQSERDLLQISLEESRQELRAERGRARLERDRVWRVLTEIRILKSELVREGQHALVERLTDILSSDLLADFKLVE